MANRRNTPRGDSRSSQPSEAMSIKPISLWSWLDTSYRQALDSLVGMAKSPFSNLLTCLVIGFSLALPALLFNAVKNLKEVGEQWQDVAQISLYLTQETSLVSARALLSELNKRSDVGSAQLIDKTTGLKQFMETSGLQETLTYLDENPLPHVIIVLPDERHLTPISARVLADELHKNTLVDSVGLDVEWLQRLYAMIEIAQAAVIIVAGLLASAVVLIIINTIRLNILNLRDEIVVMKFVGATNGFIQRPFLWKGVWYGFFGGAIGAATSVMLLTLLLSLAERVALSYDRDINIEAFTMLELVSLMIISIALSLVASTISVKRHLREIEPS